VEGIVPRKRGHLLMLKRKKFDLWKALPAISIAIQALIEVLKLFLRN